VVPLALILAIAAMIFFALAGINIRGPRFTPEWFGVGCAFAALFVYIGIL